MSASTTIARPYARAIFDIAKNNNTFDEWDNVLSYLSFIIEDKNANDFVKNKTIGYENKALMINNILDAKSEINNNIKNLSQNFIKVLAYHGRLLYIKEIKDIYIKHVNIKLDKLETSIELATLITNEQKDEIIMSLSNKFNKKVSAIFKTNEKLLGGFLIKMGDSVIDASIAGNIVLLRNKIMM